MDKAFRNFFDGRARYPKFKKKHGRQAAEYTTSAFTWDDSALTLGRMPEPLPIRWSRPRGPCDARPSTITVSRDPAGRYFVSFLVTEDIAPLPTSSTMVGIDLGLEDVITLSTGEKTGNERFFGQEEKQLARAQRRHAKKQKGSRNREKAQRQVARLHARIADRHRDFQHQLTTRLIRENQVVCVESLAIEVPAEESLPGESHRRCRLGRTAAHALVQGPLVRAQPGRDQPLVSQFQAVFGVRP